MATKTNPQRDQWIRAIEMQLARVPASHSTWSHQRAAQYKAKAMEARAAIKGSKATAIKLESIYHELVSFN